MTKDRSDRVEDTTDTERRSNSSGENRPLAPAASVLELDEVLSALSHPRRRYLLHTLVNESSEESLSELATKVAAWKQDRTADDVTREERRRVHASLYHSHVPRLADLDIVEYQKGDDIIVRARHTDQLKAVLNGAGAELDSRQEKHAQQRDTGGSDDVEESE